MGHQIPLKRGGGARAYKSDYLQHDKDSTKSAHKARNRELPFPYLASGFGDVASEGCVYGILSEVYIRARVQSNLCWKGGRMKALVIGGTGPTGPYVVEGLLQRGC